MRTFIDTINFGVKNWWVSLLLGLLYNYRVVTSLYN